jgi:pimeloyl-ACP methyl ester carboxylesterase
MSSYVLVHGAWLGGWVWDDVVPLLEKAGHRVTVVDQLPSAGTDPASLGDLSADAAYVRRVLDDLDEPVVLVGHSYGGMVITELADDPGVRHSVYLTAFWPQRGQSLLDILGDRPLPGWIVPRDDGALAISDDLDAVREALCADLDRERAAEFLSHVVLQSAAAFGSPSTAPDRGHSTTYMICEQESVNSIPVPVQEAMSANADNVVRLPSAHMAQLSVPDELADALGRII